MCCNYGEPRWLIILYLEIHGRLQMKDRVAKWKDIGDMNCPLCTDRPETMEHLFFLCPVSSAVWSKGLQWQRVSRTPKAWYEEMQWAVGNARSNSVKGHI